MKIYCWLVSTVTSTAGALTSPRRYVRNSPSNAAIAKADWWLYALILRFSLCSQLSLMLQFLQESHAGAASERKGKQRVRKARSV